MSNKPKVDWEGILKRCLSKYGENTKPAWFCREQLSTFESHLIGQDVRARRNAKNGHGKPPYNQFKGCTVTYLNGQPDLYCDDPLYDGNPVW